MYFSLKGKKVLSLHSHCKYISDGYFVGFRTLCDTVEVFELSPKTNLFTGCGHINYVDFSMLITLMSGRGDPMERKH